MSVSIRSQFVEPFLENIPYVLAHPHSKRLPNGSHFGRSRRGLPTIHAFCLNWLQLCENYPHLITPDDDKAMEEVFALRDHILRMESQDPVEMAEETDRDEVGTAIYEWRFPKIQLKFESWPHKWFDVSVEKPNERGGHDNEKRSEKRAADQTTR